MRFAVSFLFYLRHHTSTVRDMLRYHTVRQSMYFYIPSVQELIFEVEYQEMVRLLFTYFIYRFQISDIDEVEILRRLY